MKKPIPEKNARIIIIGAGVFGLSAALHLAQRGYTDVTVIDKQQYDKTLYSYDLGCDAASADINKIIRCAYGADIIYQNLALDALESWKVWNAELADQNSSLPPGMTHEDTIYVNNGTISVTDGPELPEFEQLSLKGITEAGFGSSQYVTNNTADVTRAKGSAFEYALHPFPRRRKLYTGLVDTIGGLVHADKACRFALHKAQSLGVRFIFGVQGTFQNFIYASADDGTKSLIGLRTADSIEHEANLVIAAGGGWTPTIIPELDALCETTGGSVCFYKIPKASPLWNRFAPERFPTYVVDMRAGAAGGVYGFPRDENGILKIGYRGTKYTNPVLQTDGKERSVPVTRWTTPSTLEAIPSPALKVIKSFVAEYLPEIDEEKIPIIKSRVCWYNDSYDNHLVIDKVPGTEGLIVATGGSGHAFKYLPVLGKWIVDVIERKQGTQQEREVLDRWRWRSLAIGQTPANKLMEGKGGERTLEKQALVPDADLMTEQVAFKSRL